MAQKSAAMDPAGHVRARYRAKFGAELKLYRAPGRVNLIGEHTDYNDGFVLPAAIEYSCWAAIGPGPEQQLIVCSEQFDGCGELDVGREPQRRGDWTDYPVGVAWLLAKSGVRLPGANMYVSSEVPVGAGLSSSAAIEVAAGYALLSLAQRPIERTALALLCQRAENEFVGARCGIMDQFISCYGVEDHAVLLDCRSLEHSAIPLPANADIIICNTMVKHELAAGEYNLRRAECEEAVRCLAAALPGIKALRDVNPQQLEQHAGTLTPLLYRRARHVITENDRVHKFSAALDAGDTRSLGPLMADSHASLRDDFQVSCVELDLLVEIASRQRGLIGARMTGGGFGGCTVNLVNCADSADFKLQIARAYAEATGMFPAIYVSRASAGASDAE